MARAVNGTIGTKSAASSSWPHRLTGDINGVFMSIAVVAGVLFALLTALVAIHPAPFFFDRPIETAVQSVNARPFAWFNAFVSAFAGLVGVGVGAAVIVLTFLFRRPATLFVAFSAIYSVLYNVVNIIIQRPRPTGVAHTTSNLIGYSYPSGHVGFFLWLSVLAMVLLARRLPRPLYFACWVLAAVLVVAAALSRIYVGAHWPSDVIGGFLVGLAWTCLSLSLGRLTKPVFSSSRTGAT
jgi:undecaprenyl-diphosphatase